MEIGGYDTSIATTNTANLIQEIKNLLDWEDAVVEVIDANEFLYYKNSLAKDSWDSGSDSESMIYFIEEKDMLTIVSDREFSVILRNKYVQE